MVREDSFKMGDIVTHEFHQGLLEVTHGSKDKAMVTSDFAGSEYEVNTDNLNMVCPVEMRLDLHD